ncbi:hypothetical protein Glove_402g78 [Diversispora epigaea]|uniref:SWIM-type domain-containing protein n=1 Tax=Diversispora epigaea TaxID=1348612 RepID=A0A397H4I2_9GLOM|nr:hypothetical protein Glove_402g78 [Diversispora epigaea]
MRALYPSRHAWARVFTSKIFTAGVQTTSRVEDLNAIIKRTLTASSSLCNLADVLDARLQNEAQWNHFFEYHTMSSCMGIVSVGHDLFPEIDKQMTKYLTPTYCLRNIGEENIQEVWKITDIRPQNSKYSHFVVVVDSISYLCSCMSNISRGIICRHYFRVMMYSKIAGFHIQMIPSRWYTDTQKDNNIVTEACCFINKESAKNYSNELLTPNPSTIPKSVTHVLRRAAQRKLKYGEV